MIDLEQLKALYLRRQSCRSFDGRPLSDETVRNICETALLAPSACNAQPWKLVAVTGKKTGEIAKCLQGLGMNKFASQAGAFVVVLPGKSNFTAKAGGRLKDSDFTANDLGILTAHLVLAAEAAGIGSCIIGWRNEGKLRACLNLPEKTRIPLVIALGYASAGYEIRPKKRKPIDDVLEFLHDAD